MTLPDINFQNIRPVDGDQHAGFEELCTQLAYLATSIEEKFYRKGSGGDAGVECYRECEDGAETGWQAKYLFQWESSLESQLNNSIKTALEKHPQLVEYVVCLPFDLPDSRSRRRTSALQKWLKWREKWIGFAAKRGRDLKITLWGRNILIEQLTRDDYFYSGLILYWFNQEAFSSIWFKEKFGKAKALLGSRYTPETNVELPIRRDFLAFARYPELQEEIDHWFYSLTEIGNQATKAIRNFVPEESEQHFGPLAATLGSLTSLLNSDPIGPDKPYPTISWKTAASRCSVVAGEALKWTYDLPLPNTSRDQVSWVRHYLLKLMDVLYEIDNALSSNRWCMINNNAVLLQGPAGIGKSHLLADIVSHHLDNGGPVILLLGSQFVDNEPWPQIREQLDRPSTEQFKHFLGSLDAAAQVAGVRALVCIDALNERNGINIWPARLAAFLHTISSFHHIGVILSCRTTYIKHVIPDTIGKDKLFNCEHTGFAATGGEAANTYLDIRGIVRHGAPNLLPELDNPLFLKTCCDALESEGGTEFPRGMSGVTSIFDFYNISLVNALNRRMQLDHHQNIVLDALSEFVQLLISTGKGYAPKEKVVKLFESFLSSGGRLEKSLLSQMESEGLVTVELVQQDDGTSRDEVRFTFQRYSDHVISDHLLNQHLDDSDVLNSFQPGQFLHNYVFGRGNIQHAGVIEAMAIQIPERTCHEILDFSESPPFWVQQAFKTSLLWRKQSRFTSRTFSLVRRLFPRNGVKDILISIGTEPSNQFNALYLNEILWKMNMPDRDAFWSIYLAERGCREPVETLIHWAIRNGMEHIETERAHLAATMLTWLFTTSNREVRDKATKALACLLSVRLPLADCLLRKFVGVNDPYVLERLLASCYGAVLQGQPQDGLRELAQTVFDTIFADGKPPVNALIRDHAFGIIEYTACRGTLNSTVDLTLTRPPYQSPWPIEPVVDELIEIYTKDGPSGKVNDHIVTSSTGSFSDFALYVIDVIVSKWYSTPANTFWARRWVCKQAHDLGWTQELFETFDDRQGGPDRNDHKVERVGKKYQWLALQELVARMIDNMKFLGNGVEQAVDEPPIYPSAHQVGLRDIDPSLLISHINNEGKNVLSEPWWVPFDPKLRTVSPIERLAWLECDDSIINSSELIGLTEPRTKREWLALRGYSVWSGYGVPNGRRMMQRQVWFRLNCIVVERKDHAKVIKCLRERVLTSTFDLPYIEYYNSLHLGEYPWHPDIESLTTTVFGAIGRSTGVQVKPTVVTYKCESGDYDYSIDRTVSIEIPAPWLAENMKLRLNSGRTPNYVGADGKKIFYDPSLVEAGPAAALVDRDAFLQMLDKHGLSAVWVIAGEKNIYGGSDLGAGFGGRISHTAIYSLDNSRFTCDIHTERIHPKPNQLEKFFED